MKNLFLFVLLTSGCVSAKRQDIVNYVDARARPIPWIDNIPVYVATSRWFGLPEANPGDCVLMITWIGDDHPMGMGFWGGPGSRNVRTTKYGRYNFVVARIPPETQETDRELMPGVLVIAPTEKVYFLAYKVQDSACDRGYYSDQE
jgi:hypothetical protein